MKEIFTKKTSATTHKTQNDTIVQVSATPHNRRILKMKFPMSTKTNSAPQMHAHNTQANDQPPRPFAPQSSTIQQQASQHIPQVHTYPTEVNNRPLPPLTSQSNIILPTSQPRTLKKRLFSTSKSNSTLDQPNIQPPFSSQINIQPTHDFAHESIHEATPEIQSESEEEEIEMQTEQSKCVSRKRSWLVDVIDDQGTKCKKQLTVNDGWFLSTTERIVVNWNTEDQPIDNAGALLNRFLGRVARNVNAFPISYESWRKIPRDYKEDVLKNTIQAKFEVDSDAHVKYIFKSLNTKWSEYRQQLWQQRNDGTRNRDELIAMGPEGVNRDHWASFVDYRLNSRTKEIFEKNKDNRKRQTLHHTGGSKSIARKKDEMEQEFGRKVSRGEVWIATHKHANGDFVNDEAKEISEKIQAYESNTSSLSQGISTQDSLAHALGSQEHCGRVRGMGLGPCPSRVFGYTRHSYSGMSSSSPSYKELQNQTPKIVRVGNKTRRLSKTEGKSTRRTPGRPWKTLG